MTKIIIVGAGPAGSVLATKLAENSFEVLLIDKATFPRDKICGDYLNPGAVRLIEELGLLPSILDAGARRLRGMTLVSPDETAFQAEHPKTSRRGRASFGLAIPRRRLDALLLERAKRSGVRFLEGFRVTDLVWSNGRISGIRGIGPSGSLTLQGKMVVGADGRGSVIARRLALHGAHPAPPRMALVTYYAGEHALLDHALVTVGKGSYCILNPVGEDLINVSMVLDQAVVQPWKGRLGGLFLRTLAEFPRAARALRSMTPRERVRCLGPLAFRAKRASKAGALLIGDAAGFRDPFTGEGVCHALWGAKTAAHLITQAFSSGDLSDAFLNRIERWQRMWRRRERLSALFEGVMVRPALANRLAHLLQRSQTLADRLMVAVSAAPRPLFPGSPADF